MNKLEALADAIAGLNDWTNPESDAYRLRNPGLLRSFTLRHAADDNGWRIFPRLVDGYQALIYDLREKCSGQSRSKLKPTQTIADLLVKGYSQPRTAADYVLCFLRQALELKELSAQTPLKFFVEDK